MSNQGVSPQMMSFLEQEKKKAAVNEIIGQLTSLCWDKCMSTPGRKLSYGEEQCLSNCAQRFFESSQVRREPALSLHFLFTSTMLKHSRTFLSPLAARAQNPKILLQKIGEKSGSGM